MIDFNSELSAAKSVSDIFKLVKSAVWISLGQSRSGLELGLVNLDNRGTEFIGAFYPQDSNIIVVNRIPLERIAYLDIDLYNPYLFHMLLYEYLRSIGYHDAIRRKELVHSISEQCFGGDHIVTSMAYSIKRFFPNATYAIDSLKSPIKPTIVKNFDHVATSYIM